MSDLDRLFYWRGIAADYKNFRGEHVQVPIEYRVNLLRSMGVDVSSPEKIAEEAFALDVEPWQHCFPRLVVSPSGPNAQFEINISPERFGERFQWSLEDRQHRSIADGSFAPDTIEETGEYLFEGRRFSRRRVCAGDLAPGYYVLKVSSPSCKEQTTLAVYPQQTASAEWIETNSKIWGVIVQLYTLKSDRSWGIGDFGDLAALLQKIAATGADVVGLNPLHVLSPDLETHFSPYSPSDRRYINPLYIDIASIADFSAIGGQVDLSLVDEVRGATAVDYQKVRDLKYSVLQQMFASFLNTDLLSGSSRSQSFCNFVEKHKASLLDFAFYEACYQRWQGATFIIDSAGDSTEIAADIFPPGQAIFPLGQAKQPAQLAVLFHCYLQWLADLQLENCQTTALSCGMKVGLIRDLAVGAEGGGAEVSANTDLFCRGSAIGAPPDPLAQTGQNWGLPPVIPSELRNTGFKHLIELFRSNMQHCGALRIDHAMSLMRLWWCPPGQTADHGAYIYYPFTEMLGLLTLESHLNNCLIIGEDLGVVPDEFRQAIGEAKVFSNKVFYFEKDAGNQFRAPQEYDVHSLAMVNNHDVPTLASWWNSTDLELRRRLDLLEQGVNYKDVCQARAEEKMQVLGMLQTQGLYPESWQGKTVDQAADRDLIDAILLLLSHASSTIFVMQLEDFLLMDEPVNVPGTFKEHANWQRKLSATIDEIFANERIMSLLNRIDAIRKNNKKID